MVAFVDAGCLGLSEEHRALRDSVRELARRHITPSVVRAAVDAKTTELPGFWGELVAQGLLGLHLPEEYAGAGAGLLETAVVLEELGRALAPGPYLPTVLASAVLAAAAHTDHLADLATGTVGAIALESGSVVGSTHGEVVRLTGTTGPALSASLADVLLVPALVDGTERWVVLTSADVTTDDPAGLDLTRRAGTIAVDATIPAGALLAIDPEHPRDLAAALFAAEASGIAAWTSGTAADHAAVREQFGRPIGQFQGVKHRCARMLATAEQARACAWDAATALDDARVGRTTSEQAALAAAVAGAVAPQAAFDDAKDCIQVLGGIGFTWEHDAGLYLRRAHALRLLLGPTVAWQQRVADLTLAGVRRELAPELPPHAERIRAEVRAELAPAVTLDADEQRRYLAEHGYTGPHYPAPWGKGADAVAQLVIAEELRAHALVPHDMVIGGWVVPTLLAHGTTSQQERYVPASLRGDLTWCQLFSEPGAGSDLASLSTRAERVEGGWRITGQKVWTSAADRSEVGVLLARTDPTVAKHRGLTYFLLDMTTPGIDIRPLRELTGEHLFNEVFLDGVFIPDDHVVGEPGDGWRLARTTLANERVAMASSSALGQAGEDLVALAGAAPDAHRRATLGRVVADAQTGALLGLRGVLRAVAGLRPGAESSIAKVVGTPHIQEVWELITEWRGAEAAYAEPQRGDSVWWFLNSRCLTIAGGTTEIQLNIIGERLLGLPRDPEPGR
ncbi:MAG TPA: acyl-CoA dehydrogenase [Nocardioides sp.]|nr:acyl-CoA dehydrogenase [Nocardioides sp.]